MDLLRYGLLAGLPAGARLAPGIAVERLHPTQEITQRISVATEQRSRAPTEQRTALDTPLPPTKTAEWPGTTREKALDPASLPELVMQARRGEARALEVLARAYLRPAYSVALAILRRPADAEDAAHDALLIAFERLDTCREPARFPAWLMTIVRNHSKNQLARRRLRDVPERDSEPEGRAGGAGPELGVLRQRLIVALDRVSGMEREVVLLHDLEGLTHAEIADLLDISCVMSRQHLFVARRKLRQELGNELDRGDDHE